METELDVDADAFVVSAGCQDATIYKSNAQSGELLATHRLEVSSSLHCIDTSFSCVMISSELSGRAPSDEHSFEPICDDDRSRRENLADF
eukprot:m.373937 g.373937  ORF g.373937 m.373937 type:complete len:90 (+) comp56157_c0_seq3:91-360(+)